MKNRQSFRRQFVFWLDDCRPDESSLIDFIDELKQQRGYARAIRDGLRLLRDLRQGNTDVLLELFPHVLRTVPTPATALPTFSPMPSPIKPEVKPIDESKAQAISIQNALAALDDF